MRRFRRIFAIAAVACLVPILAAATETEKVHKVVPLGPGGVLKLHNFSGTIRITGADVTDVTIDAVRRASSAEKLRQITLEIVADGNTVRIEANKKPDDFHSLRDNVVETDFDIQVPRKTELQVDAFSSELQVRGVAARQSLHTFSGDIQTVDAVSPVKAKTFSGGISIQLASGENRPAMDLDTFSGDVRLRLPAAAQGRVDIETFSGSLKSDVPMVFRSKTGRRISATLGQDSGDNSLHVKTFSGDVTLQK